MEEEWRLHPSGLLVSNLGQVFWKSKKYPNGHYSFGNKNQKGYMRITYNNKEYRNIGILVLECFVDNPNSNEFNECDHINRCRSDNRVENLRWASRSMQNKNRDFSNFKNRKDSKKVIQQTIDGEFIKEWESTMECKRNGFDNSTVRRCCNGELKHYKGYIWKWAE